jgi:hypothetical protein
MTYAARQPPPRARLSVLRRRQVAAGAAQALGVEPAAMEAYTAVEEAAQAILARQTPAPAPHLAQSAPLIAAAPPVAKSAPSPTPPSGPEPAALAVGSADHAASVVQMCADAGFIEVAAPAIKARLDFPAVKAKLETAQEITMIAKSLHLPNMAAPLIRSDMTIKDAREVLFTSKAIADDAIITDTSAPAERRAGTPAPIDADAIHRRMNERHLHQTRQGKPANATALGGAAR